jgi:anti-sigma factor RsiW
MTMKWQCALLQRWLPEYPEGDLPAFWRGRLKAHLECCPACREELATLREVVEVLQAAPVADPGPEFWAGFSREMHLKLVQATQEEKMAPPRSVWQNRLPYLVGAPALAALFLYVAVGYLNPERPGLMPPAQMAQQPTVSEKVAARPQARQAEVAQTVSAPEKMASASAPLAPPAAETPQKFVYVSQNGAEEAPPDDELDDLETTLAGMSDQEKEAFLKKLSQHQKDGSCLQGFSSISWA